jgi:hypothetical protein
MRVDGEIHAPTALPPKRTRVTHCTAGWVGARDGLEVYKNFLPLVFDLRTVQSVAGRYMDNIVQGISIPEGV